METAAPKVLKINVLEFLNSSLVLDGLQGTVDVADASGGSSRGSVLVMKYNHHLLTFRYDEVERNFDILKVDYNIFETEMIPGPWYLPKAELVAVRNVRSFQTYRLVDDKWMEYVNYINERDCEEMLLGKFYEKNALLEALVKDGSGWKFISYKDSGWTVKRIQFPSEWMLPGSDVQVLTNFDAGNDVFMLRTANVLRIYNINASQKFECIVKYDFVKPPEDSKFERIAFANFSNAKYKDMLHFSSVGLNVYRFRNDIKSYKSLYYSSKFSEFRNWNADYVNSIIVHDMDGDGAEELLFTGPSGLQVFKKAEDDNEFYLNDVVLKSADNVQRFMALKTIMPKKENDMLSVILYDESKLLLVNVRNDTDTMVLFPEEVPKKKAQPKLSLITPAANYTRWLHEQLDLSELLQPVNSLTGKVELSIPLVQLDNPFGISVHKAFQYRDIQGDRFLARGWCFPLDYITVDRRGSILEENFRYSIMKQSNQMALIPHFELSTNEVIYFEVQNQLVLRYFKQFERWEMENKREAMRYIFGKYNSSEALQYMEHDKVKEFPIAWYLIREEDSSNSFVQYAYTIEDDNVHLANIITDLGASVRFHYDKGQMRNFTVQTRSYKQVVDLAYATKEESKTYLTEIKQDDHTVFEFQYDYKSERVVTIVYPNGLKSALGYKSVEINRKDCKELNLIDKDFSVHYGPDYSVIVQTGPDKSYALLEVRDLLGGLFTTKTFNDTLSTEDPLISYQVVTLENLFGIVVSLNTKKIANLYQFKNQEWDHTEYNLSLDAIVTANTNSLFIMDDEVLKTVEVIDNGALVVQKQNVPKNVVVHTTYRGILLYDDKEFILRYSVKNEHFQWRYEIPGLIQLMHDTVDRFQLDEETRTNLLRVLKLDMLQFYNSCIILRTLEVDKSGNFIIRLKINRLDKNHQLVQDDNWRVYLGPVKNMSLEAKSAAGDTCVIRYVLRGNKYATEIKTCEGPTITEIESDFQKEIAYIQSGRNVDRIIETAKSIVKYSNRRGAFEKKMLKDNPFAFDVFLLGVSIDRNGIRTGGKIVSFNGTNWRQQNQEIGVDLTLRDKLKLKKLTSANDTYKIINDEQILFDSQTADTSSVKLVWPHYFASQSKEDPPRIYLFDKNETIQLEAHEKLSALSNNLVVITTDRGNATVLLRPVSSFLQSTREVLSNQTLELNTNEIRITTYEHVEMVLDALSNDYVFTQSRIVPGGNTTKFGWYEHRYDPVSRELSRIVSDSEGSYIKNIDPEIGGQYEKPNSTTVITDKSGRLPIVDIGPMNVTDGEYSYYGFETYERTLFEKEQRWKFNNDRLVIENGNRFLQLENGNDRFEGTVHMKMSNETYILSCWINTDTVQKIGDEIKLATITLVDRDDSDVEIGKGIIQQIVDDWYYVELQIKTRDLRNAVTANLSITPTNKMTLRVDHVRFSPMSVDFKAYIYRQSYCTVSAVLHNNGLVTQYLLDPHGNRVVFVSESGKVTDFITYSKTYYIRASQKLPHVMEIRPRDGVVERFNDSFSENWNPINRAAWETVNGYLIHKKAEGDLLKINVSTKCDMFVVRFVYNLQTKDAAIQLVVNESKVDALCRSSKSICATGNVPDYGEIVVFVSKSHKAVWFEGTLMYEASHSIPNLNEVGLNVAGSVKISEMLILYDPSIKITYYNRLGLPRQTLFMQDEDSVRIKEVLYDEIDRSIITTKWTTVKKSGDLLFDFHQCFITSVKSSKLEGLVDQLNPDCKGYPYFRKDYANNPTTVEAVISMPGETFSKDRKYFRQLSRKSNIKILDVLFPSEAGFTQQVETRQNISCHVMISNAKNQKVAFYIQTDDSDRRMTTYEYDGDYLILELPPMYHVLAGTFNRTKAFWNGDKTAEDNQLQQQWGNRYAYNDKGQMLSKRTPDSGIQRFVYDDDVVRFLVHSDGNRTDKTVLLFYGATGKIVKEAIVDVQHADFPNFSANSTLSAKSSNYVEYYYGEFDPSPNIRYRSQQSMRRSQDKQMIESLVFDNNDKITKKVHVVPALNTSYSIDYEYLNDKLIMVRYPIDVNGTDFKLMYSYNNAGDMVSIGTLTNPVRFAKLQYNADGLVQEIQFEPGSSSAYKREFDYNEPGYLKRISDTFLEEKVSYLEADGYGSAYSMIFEGLISKTSFTASWHQRSNPALSRLQLRKIENINKTQAEYCLTRLLLYGYFDYHFHPLKSFYPILDDTVGQTCRSKQLRKVFHANGFSTEYGHSYEYDSHEQLVKAKYFQSSSEASWKPLVETTFSSKIREIDGDTSRKIWANLIDNGFIVRNCYNPGICEGAPGNNSLLNDIIPNGSHIQALLLNAIAKVQTISPVNFAQKCAKWTENAGNIDCCKTWIDLLAHNFVGAHSNKTQNALNPTFRNMLRSYSSFVPQIVQVLHQHFATRLGKSPGDVLSCRFDANGNHRLFNRGFDRYLFTYKEGTNQIHTMVKSDIDDDSNNKTYRMEHNSEGSVTVAEHKGIQKIEYDPLLNRPSRIEMADGRVLKFDYDVRGERTFKQVLDKNGNIWKEKYYIRDLNRNVLVDLQLTFVAKDKSPDMQVTSYVYSNRGLVGFVRNNEFYSVFTDHEGSTRLVIKNGEVKAAYDYLPFGVAFRKAEEDLDGGISYLYTGQEWDEETGLYNYHTRLYDPEIGRFYQIDPKNQYPSPYVYAGNSPVTLVDPDGQFFMLLVAIALTIVGAYLGAAAANGSWNPAEWDWKSPNTWLAITGGALSGAALPFSIGSTLTYFTTTLGLSVSTSVSIVIGSGIGFTYLSMAAANSNWNPAEWDMKSPVTWNAFFQGISTSVSVLNNPNTLVSSYNGISTYVGKGLFIGGKLVLTTGFVYMFGVIQQNGEFDPSKWDFSKPGLYMSMFDGAMQATATVTFVTNLPKDVKMWVKKISSALDRMDEIDTFLAYNRHLGSDWSKKLSEARYFLKANSANFNAVGKTTFNIFLYTVISSLRMSQTIENNVVPEFGIMIEFIEAINTIGSFTDKLVNELVPADITAKTAMVRKMPDNIEVPEYSALSSGASKLFSSILDFINFRFIIPDQAGTSRSDITNYIPTNSSTGRILSIPNCYQLYDARSAKSFVHCYGHRSKILIHFKHSYDGIAEDVYHTCYPLSHYHIPSVSCEGEKSSLLFTAYDRPKMFDFLDGWVLLARVMPTAVRSIVRCVRSVFGSDLNRTLTVRRDEAEMLVVSLDGFDRMKEVTKTVTWAEKALEELNEDIVEFLDAPRRDFRTYVAFKERIAALQEDILEDFELRSSRMDGHLVNFKSKIQELNILQPPTIQCLMHEIDLLAHDGGKMLQ
ncbi:uncharacterized protein LOC135709951 [Ochlerotatus camptorhynchus]|uniref:uncharacterized protein LOC135709951 n=1 Tax=Ochlerotatus camptorhynchus TaxID=644619 RepID=UPI0031DD1294